MGEILKRLEDAAGTRSAIQIVQSVGLVEMGDEAHSKQGT